MSQGGGNLSAGHRPPSVRRLKLAWLAQDAKSGDARGPTPAKARVFDAPGIEGAHERLQHLYQISQRLTRFEGVEQTMPEIIALVAQALPLRHAIFMLKSEDSPQTLLWQPDGDSADGLRAAEERARTAYAYLLRDDVELEVDGAQPEAEPEPRSTEPASGPTRSDYLILPIVVDDRAIFGALLLECANEPGEVDLVFVNAVVNQLSVALDRHARIEASEAERRWLEAIVAQLPAGVIVRQGPTGSLVVANSQAERIWGGPIAPTVYGADAAAHLVAFHPGTRREYAPDEWPLARSLAKGEAVTDEEIELLWDDGTRHTMLVTSTPIASPDRDVVSGVETFYDITQQKRAEHAQRFLAEVGLVLASTLDYTTSLARVARLAVPALADVCFVDLAFEDGSVRRLGAAFSDPDTHGDLAESIDPRPAGGWSSAFAPILRDDKRLYDAGLRSMMRVPLLAQGRAHGALTFLAVEAHRYAAADLDFAEEVARRASLAVENARLYEQARRSSQAREELLAIVSHDLRNPLSVILMTIADVLKDASDGGCGQEVKRELERIKRSASRMTWLIEDLLDAASIEAGHLSLSLNHLAVPALIGEALEAAQPLAARKSLHVATDLQAGLPSVRADGRRIQQVLANLLGNAIKFTPDAGTIIVRASLSGNAVRFSVIDTGPGIAKKDQPHVFERFWQAHGTARMGTGLGLFIARAIVQSHGGELAVESAVGKGTTFCFCLPAV